MTNVNEHSEHGDDALLEKDIQFTMALSCYTNQQYEDTIKQFNECIKNNNRISESHYYIAQTYLKLNDIDKSIEHYRISYQHCSKQKDIVDAYLNYGMLLLYTSRYYEAMTFYQSLMKIDYKKIDFIIGFAYSLSGLGNYVHANVLITNTMKVNHIQKMNLLLIQVYLCVLNQMNQFEDVLNEIKTKKLLECFPDDKVIKQHCQLAYASLNMFAYCFQCCALCKKCSYCEEVNECYLCKGSDVKCKINNEQTIPIETSYINAYTFYKLAISSEIKNQNEKEHVLRLAKQCCLNCINKQNDTMNNVMTPKNSSIYLILAKVKELLHENDKEIIEDAYNKCIKLNPYVTECYEGKCTIFLNYANYKKAHSVLDKRLKEISEETHWRYEHAILNLHYAKVLSLQTQRAESIVKLTHVRNMMMNKSFLEKLCKSQICNILELYFEIYHMCNYYSIEQLKIDYQQRIGSGGFSVVYKGTLQNMNVAVKEFIMNNVSTNPKSLTRKRIPKHSVLLSIFHEVFFMEELGGKPSPEERFIEQCNPYLTLMRKNKVLQVIAIFFINREKLSLITPLCTGGSLHSILFETKIKVTLPTYIIIDILLQIAETLKRFHTQYKKPFIHHDIKPQNIFLEQPLDIHNKVNNIVIGDFGLMEYDTVQSKGLTLYYAAPEQLKDKLIENCSSDVYSFLLVAWVMYSHKIPFSHYKTREELINAVNKGERPDVNEIKDKAPLELYELIQKGLESNHHKRPKWDEIIGVLQKLKEQC